MIKKIDRNLKLIKFVFSNPFENWSDCVLAYTTRISNGYKLTNSKLIEGQLLQGFHMERGKIFNDEVEIEKS